MDIVQKGGVDVSGVTVPTLDSILETFKPLGGRGRPNNLKKTLQSFHEPSQTIFHEYISQVSSEAYHNNRAIPRKLSIFYRYYGPKFLKKN